MKKLIWTHLANQDRKNIREYIATDNPRAALVLDELFFKKAHLLIDHPDLGRLGRVSGTRELSVHPKYILIYDTFDHFIRILRVLHAALQWP